MSRWDFIKAEWLRCAVGLFVTALLPFSADWHNPAGAQPLTIISFLAAMYWVGFIGMMLLPDSARADFLGKQSNDLS